MSLTQSEPSLSLVPSATDFTSSYTQRKKGNPRFIFTKPGKVFKYLFITLFYS